MTAVTMLPESKSSAPLPAVRMRATSISLLDALRLLWRRKFLLSTIVIAGTGIATAIAFSIQPRYAAMTELLLDPRPGDATAPSGLTATLGIDRTSVYNEIEILRSPTIAEKVLDRLKLWSDPEFDVGNGLPSAVSNQVAQFFGGLTGIGDQMPASAESAALRHGLMVLEAFLDRIAVRPLGQSLAVDVQFEANGPTKAALIANTIVQAYIATVIDDDQQREQKQRDWLKSRVVELRKNVADAERTVAEMTVRHGIAEINQVTVTDRQLADTSSELARARAGRGEVAAKLGVVLAALDHGEGAESVAEVQNSQLIQRLKEQEAVVVQRIGELGGEWARHPKMIDARAELTDLRAKIRAENGPHHPAPAQRPEDRAGARRFATGRAGQAAGRTRRTRCATRSSCTS